MPAELAAALTADEALIALRDLADLQDCDVLIRQPGPPPYAYAVAVRRRGTLGQIVAGHGARIGELGRAIRNVLAGMP